MKGFRKGKLHRSPCWTLGMRAGRTDLLHGARLHAYKSARCGPCFLRACVLFYAYCMGSVRMRTLGMRDYLFACPTCFFTRALHPHVRVGSPARVVAYTSAKWVSNTLHMLFAILLQANWPLLGLSLGQMLPTLKRPLTRPSRAKGRSFVSLDNSSSPRVL